MDMVRTANSEPSLPAAAMGDHPSAMTMYAGVMTALYQRQKTGKGSKVYSSLMANGLWAASSTLAGVLAGTSPMKRLNPSAPGNALVNHYLTRDDRWLSLIVLQEEKNWPIFVEAIEQPELLNEPRFVEKDIRHKNGKALAAILRKVFKARDCKEWERRLRDHNVTFSVVATMEEVVVDQQALANDMIIDVEGHHAGRGQSINSPFWVQGADKVPARLAPELGAQGAEILQELGYDGNAVKQLLSKS